MPRCERPHDRPDRLARLASLARFARVLLSALSLSLAASACASAKTSRGDVLSQGSPHPLIGRPAPVFTTATLDGGEVSLHSARAEGRSDAHVTVVHFFATWAEASKETLPKLEQLWSKYHASGLEVIALSVDDIAAPVPDFVRTYGVKYPVAWDGGKALVRHWLAPEVPATFIIDARGVVRAAFLGYDDGFESEIEIDVRILTAERDADRTRALTRALMRKRAPLHATNRALP
jgi:peroxiredoxin